MTRLVFQSAALEMSMGMEKADLIVGAQGADPNGNSSGKSTWCLVRPMAVL
jgi:hypothetical protein